MSLVFGTDPEPGQERGVYASLLTTLATATS